MAKSNKKEETAAKKAEAAKKASEELSRKQTELAEKAEDRNKKRAAEIAERNKKTSSIENKNTEPTNIEGNTIQNTNESPESNSNNIIENANQEVTTNQNQSSADGGEQNINTVEQSTEQTTSGEIENDIPSDLNDMDIPEDIQSELDNISSPENYSVPDDDFDPLKEKLIKRSYTDGSIGGNKEKVSIDDVQQPSSGDSTSSQGGGNTPPPQPPPAPEPVIEEPVIKNPSPEISPSDISGDKDKTTGTTQTQAPKPPPVNPKLNDLSPSQKRKAAEKTADALITTYANLVPIPFKKISSFNMRKLEQRHINDELDMNMVIMDDGTTVVNYAEGVNKQADEIFVVTKTMQDEIREPLVDVLLENNFALTPTQNLIMIVGGQIVQMGITAIQFMQQNSNAMETFKQFHEENKADKVLKAQIIVERESKNNHQENRSEERPKRQQSNVSQPTSNDTSTPPVSDEVRESVKSSENLDIPEDDNKSNDKITVEEFLENDNDKK